MLVELVQELSGISRTQTNGTLPADNFLLLLCVAPEDEKALVSWLHRQVESLATVVASNFFRNEAVDVILTLKDVVRGGSTNSAEHERPVES